MTNLNHSLLKQLLHSWIKSSIDLSWPSAKRKLSKELNKAGVPSNITRGMWLTFNHLLTAFETNSPSRISFDTQVQWVETYLRIYINTKLEKVTSLKPSQVKRSKTAQYLDNLFTVWAKTYNLDLPWHQNWNRLATVLVHCGYPKTNVQRIKYALETTVGPIGDVDWRTQRELLRLWINQLSISVKFK
jgi:hypothetical protein